MEREELYNKTIDILVKAYKEGSLVHGDACACAVGNLVLANCKSLEFYPLSTKQYRPVWTNNILIKGYSVTGLEQIHSTGYSLEEIRFIEESFEECIRSTRSDYDKLDLTGQQGAFDVIDTLDKIHKNENIMITDCKKHLFT